MMPHAYKGKIELVVLGSGSYAPPTRLRRNYPVRNPSGYAVNIQGEILIFDFGSGSLRNLARAGMDFTDISHVFITHFHIDHWTDILSLLFLFHFAFRPKSGSLTIAGPAGTKRVLGGLMSACGSYVNPTGYRLKIREIKAGQPFPLKTDRLKRNWTVSAKNVRHCMPSFCYRLDYNPPSTDSSGSGSQSLIHGFIGNGQSRAVTGPARSLRGKGSKSITYTGDASYDKGLVEFAKNSDILITDCTLPGPKAKYGHMTRNQAIELARRSGSKKTILSHISPKAESAMRKKAGKDLTPSILVGTDLMKIKV